MQLGAAAVSLGGEEAGLPTCPGVRLGSGCARVSPELLLEELGLFVSAFTPFLHKLLREGVGGGC